MVWTPSWDRPRHDFGKTTGSSVHMQTTTVRDFPPTEGGFLQWCTVATAGLSGIHVAGVHPTYKFAVFGAKLFSAARPLVQKQSLNVQNVSSMTSECARKAISFEQFLEASCFRYTHSRGVLLGTSGYLVIIEQSTRSHFIRRYETCMGHFRDACKAIKLHGHMWWQMGDA